jgi:hypothetical protein
LADLIFRILLVIKALGFLVNVTAELGHQDLAIQAA